MATILKPAKNSDVLKKRLKRFFEDVPHERRSAVTFVNDLCKTANVLVFGGLVRDIALHGGAKFRSDLDLVVQVEDRDAFENFIAQKDFSKNKFGGYRIQEARWVFDLWEFHKTWAFSEKLVHSSNKKSLLNTTFFNWDAIFYEPRSKQLTYQNKYFENLCNRHLDINLEKNPNSTGAFVRALRFIIKENALTSKKLSEFIVENLSKISDDEIIHYDDTHFTSPMLGQKALRSLRTQAEKSTEEEYFQWFSESQSDLFDLHVT